MRSPAICALTYARTTGGLAERRFVELVLDTFARAGLSRQATVRYYRAFVDTALGLAAQVATLATLPPEVQAKDAAAWTRIYARLPEEEYPTARAHIDELTAVGRREIYDVVLEAIIVAAERELARASLERGR